MLTVIMVLQASGKRNNCACRHVLVPLCLCRSIEAQYGILKEFLYPTSYPKLKCLCFCMCILTCVHVHISLHVSEGVRLVIPVLIESRVFFLSLFFIIT